MRRVPQRSNVEPHEARRAEMAKRAATMLTRPDDLNRMLLEAQATRACWAQEAQRAIEEHDGGREVACEYQLCLIDGLIALIQHSLVH
jgi:hypothetical protein